MGFLSFFTGVGELSPYGFCESPSFLFVVFREPFHPKAGVWNTVPRPGQASTPFEGSLPAYASVLINSKMDFL